MRREAINMCDIERRPLYIALIVVSNNFVIDVQGQTSL